MLLLVYFDAFHGFYIKQWLCTTLCPPKEILCLKTNTHTPPHTHTYTSPLPLFISLNGPLRIPPELFCSITTHTGVHLKELAHHYRLFVVQLLLFGDELVICCKQFLKKKKFCCLIYCSCASHLT